MNEIKTILVVEDQFLLLQNIIFILELNGFKTLKASDGMEGLLVATTYKPDLILSDLMMENMSGYELLEKLKEDPSTQHIPFIFLTARADVIDKDKGLGAGARAYLTKPFGAKELVAMVQTTLGII